MLRLLNCPRGHFWESAQVDAPDACPECGGPAESLPLLDLVTTAPLPPPAAPVEPPLFDDAGVPVVSGYQVLEELGRSPAGVRRYRARQAVTGRLVLLEVVAAREEASERAWNRLRGAAAALGKLAHPNILRIYEAGERDRQLFYNVGELVDGPTLAQTVADKPLPVAQIVRLMELLARTVEHAHAAGLLHRNLKPSSVLLQPVGAAAAELPAACPLHSGSWVPRLTDFGLARKATEGDPVDVELYGDEIGFLSPEQAWGRARDIGPETDVYGLGAILYFLLAGRPPFRGPSTAEVLDAIQTSDLVSPSQKRRVPADLEAICKKCLARQPRRRYATAAELADDLRRAAQGMPVTARPSSGVEKALKWARRRPGAAALLLVGALAVAGMAVAFIAGRGDRERGPTTAALRRQMNNANAQSAHFQSELEAVRLELGVWKYRQRLDEVGQLLAVGRGHLARTLLERCDEPTRGFEWHYLHATTVGGGKIEFRAKLVGVSGLAFPGSPGGFLAIASHTADKERRGEVRVWDYSRQDVWQQLHYDGPVHAVAVSADGRQLAAAGSDAGAQACVRLAGLARWPVRQEEPRRVAIRGERLTDVAYIGVERQVLAALDNGRLARINGAVGTLDEWAPGEAHFLPGRAGVSRLAATADGAHVAVYVEGGSEVRVWEATSSFRQTRWYRDLGAVQAAAVDRDGQLAVALADGTIRVYDSTGGPERTRIDGLPQPAQRLAFSPDGSRLAAGCADGKVRLWRQAGESWVLLLVLDAQATTALVFSPSGKALATAGSGQVVLWGAP